MLLDDCLPAVDTKTEELILNNIKEQSQITHASLSLIEYHQLNMQIKLSY